MVVFVMIGIVAVIGFLCISYAIPEMIEGRSRRPSSTEHPRQATSKTWSRRASRSLNAE
jgi:hypothetical protein